MTKTDKLREILNDGGGKLQDVSKKAIEKGTEIGEEGLEATRELVAGLGKKGSELAVLAKLPIEIRSLHKKFEAASRDLGEALYHQYHQGSFDLKNAAVVTSLGTLSDLNREINEKIALQGTLNDKILGRDAIDRLKTNIKSAGGLVEELVIEETSSVQGKMLMDLKLPEGALISAVIRDGNLIVPDGKTLLLAGDHLTILGSEAEVLQVCKILNS